MEDNTNNIIIYDWLSVTSKAHNPHDLISALGLSHVHWTSTKGARGYQDRLFFSGISVHFHGRADMGVWIEMSGQGCRTFESLSSTGWENLFEFIHENGLIVTRLDVAYDDHTGLLDIKKIMRDTEKGLFVSKSDFWEIITSSKGTTIQIGSPTSKVLIRIYDKAAEQGIPDEHWVRCEMQLRDDRALAFLELGMPLGRAFAGVLLNYLRFVSPGNDSNKWRWPMRSYWKRLVHDAEKISIYRAPGLEYSEERCRNFVVNQAGNAIAACIEMYGSDEFLDMIEKRTVSPNPKYDIIVQDHRRAVLGRRVQRLFPDTGPHQKGDNQNAS